MYDMINPLHHGHSNKQKLRVFSEFRLWILDLFVVFRSKLAVEITMFLFFYKSLPASKEFSK